MACICSPEASFNGDVSGQGSAQRTGETWCRVLWCAVDGVAVGTTDLHQITHIIIGRIIICLGKKFKKN